MKRIFLMALLGMFVVQCATRRNKKIFTKKGGDGSPAQMIQKAAKDFNEAMCKEANPPAECATIGNIANATEDEINEAIVQPLKESTTSEINALQNSAGVVVGGGALPDQTTDAAASAPPPSDSGQSWSQWAGDLTGEQLSGAVVFLTGAITIGSGAAMTTPKGKIALKEFLKKGGTYDKFVQLKTEQQRILHENLSRNIGLTEAQIANIQKKLGPTPSTFVEGQAPKTVWENWKKVIVDTAEQELRSGKKVVGESSLDMMKYLHEVTAINGSPANAIAQEAEIVKEIEDRMKIEVSDTGDITSKGSTLSAAELDTVKKNYGNMLGEMKQNNKLYRDAGARTGARPDQKLPADVKSATAPDRPSKPSPQMEARARTRAQMDAPKSKFQESGKMGAAFIAGGLIQMGAGAAAMYYGQNKEGLALAESDDALDAAKKKLLEDLSPAFAEITAK